MNKTKFVSTTVTTSDNRSPEDERRTNFLKQCVCQMYLSAQHMFVLRYEECCIEIFAVIKLSK